MIYFINNITRNKIGAISLEGLRYGEVKETAGLLAYENNIKESDIKIVIE